VRSESDYDAKLALLCGRHAYMTADKTVSDR